MPISANQCICGLIDFEINSIIATDAQMFTDGSCYQPRRFYPCKSVHLWHYGFLRKFFLPLMHRCSLMVPVICLEDFISANQCIRGIMAS